MTLQHLTLTLVTVLAIGGGQVLFKLGAMASNAENASLLARYANPWLMAALLLYVVATALWIYVLKHVPLNVAYPFMGLAFVVVPVAASLFAGEPLAARHLAGGVVIAAGIWIAQSA